MSKANLTASDGSPLPEFQPTMLGHVIYWGDEQGNILGSGIITDENETEIYIESTLEGEKADGWMSKAEYFESLGVAD